MDSVIQKIVHEGLFHVMYAGSFLISEFEYAKSILLQFALRSQ